MAIDFNALSDDDLLALAGQFGIDTTPFIGGGGGGLFEQVGTAPSFNQPLPTANVGQPNIPTNLPSPIGFQGGMGLNLAGSQVEISPEARATVAGIYGPIRQQAREEILRTATEAAGRRGLNMTDTPIFEPLLRQQALVESQIGGQESGALLGLSESLRNFRQQQAQAIEQALQGRFGLEAQQAAQRMNARQGLLGLSEQARQYGGQFGLGLAGLQEQATQNRFNLGNQALLGRTQMLEATRQFQSQFENRLRQQAFQNRLQLGGQISQTGLGLAGARFGTPISMTQVGPLNLGTGMDAIGLGLSGLQNTRFFS